MLLHCLCVVTLSVCCCTDCVLLHCLCVVALFVCCCTDCCAGKVAIKQTLLNCYFLVKYLYIVCLFVRYVCDVLYVS